jgi:Anti-sigma-K factor rskA, C-terminal
MRALPSMRSGSWVVSLSAVALLVAATSVATPVGVRVAFSGLQDLGAGWAYEGWFIVNGAPISTGTFTVDGSGNPSRDLFSADVPAGAAVSSFVLTIEPSPDPDPAPSGTHYLAGDFAGSRATLSVGHPAALGNDFTHASGSYILAAPSAGADGDYHNGIWWLDPVDPPLPGLSLPPLPAGWQYEGWVVGPDGPVSTGRFRLANAADFDGGGPAAGPNPTPPFPGEDFVDPAVDLTAGYAAVITIEPQPDNSPAPFTLKPLVDNHIDDLGAKVSQFMANNAASFPTGTATLLRAAYFPVTAHATGFNGTMWRTDLTVGNAMSAETTFDVEFFRAGGGYATARFTVAPQSTADYPDVIFSTLGMTGIGATRVWLESNDAVGATSRTYNDTSAGPLGAVIRPLWMSDAFGAGRDARLLQLSSSSDPSVGFHTNVGVLNVSDVQISIEVELFASGASLGTVTAMLKPNQLRQFDDIFALVGAGDVASGYAVVTTSTPGGAFLTYASVVHNRSGAFFYHTP